MKKISILIGILVIIAAVIILFGGVFWFMQNAKIKNQNDNTKVQNKTAGWKTYKNDTHGFEFKYPANFSINNNYTTDLVLLNYDNYGQHSLLLTVEDSNISLGQNVKVYVANEEAHMNSVGSAAPLSIAYKPYQIGNLNGYLILRQAGDIPINSDAIFKAQKGNSIFSFSYSYQAFIFRNPSDITGGGPITADLQSEIKSKVDIYNQIQAIISTFKFTK